jgi:hypothetical protein
MSIEFFSARSGATPALEGPLAPLLYDHPDDVVADDLLTDQEKRKILSSWASDAFAVESAPALRAPPFARTAVTIDDIMAALAELDSMIAR